jgi:hypothetical protein
MRFFNRITGWTVSVLTLLALSGLAGDCFGAATVVYDSGRLTVHAVERPLEEVLEGISAALDADVYVAEECRSEPVTIELVSTPVEAALGRILRSVSYAVLYRDSESGPRISGLRVYPRGKAGSAVALVKRGEAIDGASMQGQSHHQSSGAGAGVSAAVSPGGVTRHGPGHSGISLPQRPVPTGIVSLASVKAMEGWESERALQEEIRALEVRAGNAGDEDAKEALTVSLMEKIQEFHQLQKTNRNTQAALRRIELFHAQKAAGVVQ